MQEIVRGRLLVLLLGLTVPGGLLQAQEGSRPREKTTAAYRFFEKDIDFWLTGKKREKTQGSQANRGPFPMESIWAEPVRMPDGRYAVYVPPKAVLEFLEDPTPESLRGYLKWKRARAEKLQRALRLLEAHRVGARAKEEPARKIAAPRIDSTPVGARAISKEGKPSGAKKASPVALKGRNGNSTSILYFHKKG